MVLPRWTLLPLMATLATPASANTYCCTDENGRRVCGDILPSQCMRRAYQELNYQGKVTKEVEGPLTPEQKAEREAEKARLKAAQRVADEERRRNQALRASYSSVKDIDAKRDRMLGEAEASLKAAQERYQTALERRQKLGQELEFYQKTPVPAALKRQIKDSEDDVVASQATIANRRQDMDAIRVRFEEERRQYIKLTGRSN